VASLPARKSRIGGGTVSPTRSTLGGEPSTRQRLSSGATICSMIAAAAPAGPAPAMTTSKSVPEGAIPDAAQPRSSTIYFGAFRSEDGWAKALGGRAGLRRTKPSLDHSVTILRSPALVCGIPLLQST
jgi:hypothetical protein